MISKRSWTSVCLSKTVKQLEARSGWRYKLSNQDIEVAVAESRAGSQGKMKPLECNLEKIKFPEVDLGKAKAGAVAENLEREAGKKRDRDWDERV